MWQNIHSSSYPNNSSLSKTTLQMGINRVAKHLAVHFTELKYQHKGSVTYSLLQEKSAPDPKAI